MKKILQLIAVLLSTVHGQQGPLPKINYWVTPIVMSGILTFLFLLFVAYIGFGLLGDIQTPPYQLQANDEKNRENNRDWSKIWGNIEKS